MRIRNLVDRVGLPTVLHGDHDYTATATWDSSSGSSGSVSDDTVPGGWSFVLWLRWACIVPSFRA